MIQLLSPPENSDFLKLCSKLGASQVVSLIGAGGKTSTLFWLAHALGRCGVRVLVTTTTHMYLPDPGAVMRCIIEADLARRVDASKNDGGGDGGGIVACFSAFDEQTDKVSGCLPEEVEQFKKAGVADVILVEADGARHCALKVPGEHEPCIPGCSDVVIAISGGEAMLRPADPQRIHRWPLFSALGEVAAGALLDQCVFDRLLSHPQGILKGVPERAGRHWLINGNCHDQALVEMLQSLAGAHDELDGVWLGNMRQEHPFTRAWLRRRSDEQEL